MKKTALLLSLLTIFLFGFKLERNTSYAVDVNKSSVTWIGRKVTGEHAGGIKIANGKLITAGKNLKGGSFDLDMASITCTDLTGEYMDKLVGHLKADDFFGVEKYPVSKFEITSVKPLSKTSANITGNLTIKGITNSITFPASVVFKGNNLVAEAKKVMVDRTKFDIRYGSKSFFNLGDKAINNDFELNIKLIAKK